MKARAGDKGGQGHRSKSSPRWVGRDPAEPPGRTPPSPPPCCGGGGPGGSTLLSHAPPLAVEGDMQSQGSASEKFICHKSAPTFHPLSLWAPSFTSCQGNAGMSIGLNGGRPESTFLPVNCWEFLPVSVPVTLLLPVGSDAVFRPRTPVRD